jgi:hypothetical protein
MLRRYDAAVLNFLRLKLEDGSVPMGMATPRREYGKQSEMFPESASEIPSRGNQTVRLPAMVISRLNWVPATERHNLAVHRKLGWSDDLNMVKRSQHPLAYDISYQLDIWTRERDDANLLASMTLLKFPRKLAYLTVDLGEGWGEKRVALIVKNVQDLTELEPNELDREVRMTVDFELEAWLPLPITDVRTVRKVIQRTEVLWVDEDRGLDQIVYEKVLEEG